MDMLGEAAAALLGVTWNGLVYPVFNRLLQWQVFAGFSAYGLIGFVLLGFILSYFGTPSKASRVWIPSPMLSLKLFGGIHVFMFVAAFASVTSLLTMSLFIYPTDSSVDSSLGSFLPAGRFKLLSAYGWQKDKSFNDQVRFTGPAFRYGKAVTASASGYVTRLGYDDENNPLKGDGLVLELTNAFLGPLDPEKTPSARGVTFRYGGLAPYLWTGKVDFAGGHGSATNVRFQLYLGSDVTGKKVPTFVDPFIEGRPASPSSDGSFAVMVPSPEKYTLQISVVPDKDEKKARVCSESTETDTVDPKGKEQLKPVTFKVAFGYNEVHHHIVPATDAEGAPVFDAQGKPVIASEYDEDHWHDADCGKLGSKPQGQDLRMLPPQAGALGAPLPVTDPPKLPEFIWPVPAGTLVSQEFGGKYSCYASPTQCRPFWHTGMDINAKEGTPLVASADGILQPFYEPIGGHSVYITHANGWQTRYAHLTNSDVVAAGSKVRQGQLIGYIGDAAHVHFEFVDLATCHYNNPRKYIDRAGGEVISDPRIDNPTHSVGVVDRDILDREYFGNVGRIAFDVPVCRGEKPVSSPYAGHGRSLLRTHNAKLARGPSFILGEYVQQGWPLAYVGDTGERVPGGGYYLAFQVRFNDVQFDARELLPTALQAQVEPKLTTAVDPLNFLPQCTKEFDKLKFDSLNKITKKIETKDYMGCNTVLDDQGDPLKSFISLIEAAKNKGDATGETIAEGLANLSKENAKQNADSDLYAFVPLQLPACSDALVEPEKSISTTFSDAFNAIRDLPGTFEKAQKDTASHLCRTNAPGGLGNFMYDPGGLNGGGHLMDQLMGYPRPFNAEQIRRANNLSYRPQPGTQARAARETFLPRIRNGNYFEAIQQYRGDLPTSLVGAIISAESSAAYIELERKTEAVGLMQLTSFWYVADSYMPSQMGDVERRQLSACGLVPSTVTRHALATDNVLNVRTGMCVFSTKLKGAPLGLSAEARYKWGVVAYFVGEGCAQLMPANNGRAPQVPVCYDGSNTHAEEYVTRVFTYWGALLALDAPLDTKPPVTYKGN